MAKDNVAQNAAPLFAFSRSVMSELEAQADKWLDYSIQQQNEAVKIAKTLRAQAMTATKTAMDAAEQLFAKGIQQ